MLIFRRSVNLICLFNFVNFYLYYCYYYFVNGYLYFFNVLFDLVIKRRMITISFDKILLANLIIY
jgi:hypothetical protein